MLGVGDPLALAAARQRHALLLLGLAAGWLLLARSELHAARGRVRQLRRDAIDSDRACMALRDTLKDIADGRVIARDGQLQRVHVPPAPEPEPEQLDADDAAGAS